MTDSVSPSSPSGTSPENALLPLLPSAARLALVYAPPATREATLALFALDARLAGLLRHSREPMLAQLRLSWWRETLKQEPAAWPKGDPLLTALRGWHGTQGALGALVDGWEALTGPAPLVPEALDAMADGRGEAFAALARALGREGEEAVARRVGRDWALADLAMQLSHPQEREAARVLLDRPASPARLSRPLRPLGVLRGLALHRLARCSADPSVSPGGVLTALRIGLLGR